MLRTGQHAWRGRRLPALLPPLLCLPTGLGLELWFGYAKEELACVRDGGLAQLVGGGGSPRLLEEAHMVVLLQLAHRPSARAMRRDGGRVKMDLRSCEEEGGVELVDQMARRVRTGMQLVQVHQYAEGDPEAPDQSLLSIWYDPSKVAPGDAFAYKNRLAANTVDCLGHKQADLGPVNVTYDKSLSECPEAALQHWPEYATSKSILATSWRPVGGGGAFAILGANLPSKHYRGKNAMLRRAVEDVQRLLRVSSHNVFIIGDMNTRLLNSAYDLCGDAACKEPDDFQEALELSKQAWETLPGRTSAQGDVRPCAEVRAFGTQAECQRRLAAMAQCREACVARFACEAAALEELGPAWSLLDPKRGAGGFDLLPAYFTFAPDIEVDAAAPSAAPAAGRPAAWRLPTYKRTSSADVDACREQEPFWWFCSANPCLAANGSRGRPGCRRRMGACFAPSAGTKSDRLREDDPVAAHASQRLVSPNLGWLDALGYARDLASRVELRLYQDRPAVVPGDHGAFVAALALDLGGQCADAFKA